MTRSGVVSCLSLALWAASCATTCGHETPPEPADGRTALRPDGAEDDSEGESSASNAATDSNAPSDALVRSLDGAALAWESPSDGSPDATLAGDDPMALHHDPSELVRLLSGMLAPDASARWFGYRIGAGPSHINLGNKLIAHHAIGKAACLAGLHDVVIQTDEQRARCGSENMVPVFRGGDPSRAQYCIDVFEFPNVACELPTVWSSATDAAGACAQEGKRLCKDKEWNFACGGDPKGGKDSVYAYGDDLDLTICNTNKPHEMVPGYGWACNPRDADTTWASCSTNTEPAGAFPRCRSRFGVFDQHGNVAEAMARVEGENTFSQLKGSAFFYVDVARKHNELQGPGRETYPDHCNYDPRWHVEPIEHAMHVNYHLGFRCCKSL